MYISFIECSGKQGITVMRSRTHCLCVLSVLTIRRSESIPSDSAWSIESQDSICDQSHESYDTRTISQHLKLKQIFPRSKNLAQERPGMPE